MAARQWPGDFLSEMVFVKFLLDVSGFAPPDGAKELDISPGPSPLCWETEGIPSCPEDTNSSDFSSVGTEQLHTIHFCILAGWTVWSFARNIWSLILTCSGSAEHFLNATLTWSYWNRSDTSTFYQNIPPESSLSWDAQNKTHSLLCVVFLCARHSANGREKGCEQIVCIVLTALPLYFFSFFTWICLAVAPHGMEQSCCFHFPSKLVKVSIFSSNHF